MDGKINQRVYIKDLSQYKNQIANIQGWINTRRDQGKMIFFDFRDITGIVQGVVLPKSECLELAKTTKEEFVVQIKGKVNPRPERNIKEGVLNGDIELEILEIEILNQSKTLPFPIDGDTKEINELIRLKHRYLDLRSERI